MNTYDGQEPGPGLQSNPCPNTHFNLVETTFRLCLKLNYDACMMKTRSNDSCLYSQQYVPLRNRNPSGTKPSWQYVTEVRLSTDVASTRPAESNMTDTTTGSPSTPRPADHSLAERIAYVSRFRTGYFLLLNLIGLPFTTYTAGCGGHTHVYPQTFELNHSKTLPSTRSTL